VSYRIASKPDATWAAKAMGDIPQNGNFASKGVLARASLRLNDINYHIDSSNERVADVDIAARAKEFTVLAECW
tara:strand:+ start:1031 stop:1252 length:222 start_codon:yes stop_codon:yes gene_type:complete